MASGAEVWSRARKVTHRLGPQGGDAVLYAASALFAGLTAALSTISLYRQWGELATGPYLAGAVLSAGAMVLARRRAAAGRPWVLRHLRAAIFVLVLAGATLVPLSLEILWRSEGNVSAHVQPEVVVVENAAHRAARGKDPYQEVVRNGKVQIHTPGTPVYESFFPYLPLMTVFGLPSSTKAPIQLTDARIFFSVATLIVVGVALVLWRGPPDPKVRTLQFLTVLPTAALPLATGGDDMPVVAILLLAIVLAQRRQPFISGLVFGVVSAMKFTAWPLAALALFTARQRSGRRAPLRMVAGMLLVAGPVVVPFVLRGPFAFLENVVLYPLGIAGVASPAASAMPGHLFVAAFPSLHRIYPVVLVVVGAALLIRHLVRHPPQSPAQAVDLAAWAMAVAILLAPATRFGYLLYPVNFFVWGAMLRSSDPTRASGAPHSDRTSGPPLGPGPGPGPGAPRALVPEPPLRLENGLLTLRTPRWSGTGSW